MTLNQLRSLNEEELAMILFIVNEIAPPSSPKLEIYQPQHLTWFKHEVLIKKILDVFPKLLPEGHATYSSLLEKLGVKIEIKKIEQPTPEVTASQQSSGSI